MTRFARAKGSKSSNERVPEEATPWNEMKRQLLDKNKELVESKEREKIINQRNESYKTFLAEKEESESKNTVWADFPGVNKNKKLNKNVKELKSKLKFAASTAKPQTMILNDPGSDSDAPPEEASAKTEPQSEIVVKKAKKKKKTPKKKASNGSAEPKETNGDTAPVLDENGERILTEKDLFNMEKRKLKERRHKDRVKQKRKERMLENGGKEKPKGPITDEIRQKIAKKREKKWKQLERRKLKKIEEKLQNEQQQPTENNNMKPAKKRDNNEHNRRKPFAPSTIEIDGKTIEVEYVDGFPIRKEDALHLKQLRREMIAKGLPRSEINAAIKLERRKAEKALTREKKRVCFNCRQSGHNLSECPLVNQDQFADSSGTGICFKCGSTEHSYFECRVVRSQEFRFATCFVCNEQGHIAKQCPDNARGVYPKGGACNVCGDVTHLKKDCPKYQAEKQNERPMNVRTINFDNPDDL